MGLTEQEQQDLWDQADALARQLAEARAELEAEREARKVSSRLERIEHGNAQRDAQLVLIERQLAKVLVVAAATAQLVQTLVRTLDRAGAELAVREVLGATAPQGGVS